jgi:hypothetical protein
MSRFLTKYSEGKLCMKLALLEMNISRCSSRKHEKGVCVCVCACARAFLWMKEAVMLRFMEDLI